MTSEGTPRKKKTLVQVLDNFAADTSLQGVAYIRKSKRWWSSGFWTLCFLGSLIMSFYQLYYILRNFVDRPYSTVTKLGFGSLAFPSVTVCNLNPVRVFEVDQVSPELFEFFQLIAPFDNDEPVEEPAAPDSGSSRESLSAAPDSGPGPEVTAGSDSAASQVPVDGASDAPPVAGGQGVTESPAAAGAGPDTVTLQGQPARGIKRKKRQVQVNGNSHPPQQEAEMPPPGASARLSDQKSDVFQQYEAFLGYYGNISLEGRKQIGHQAESLIIDCSFNGYECSWQNFSHSLSPDYGNCYTFNNPEVNIEPVQAYKGGKQYGLQLWLFIEESDYPAGISPSTGVALAIHPYDSMGLPDINGVTAAPGFETNIGIRLVNVTRLGEPYNICRNDITFQDMHGYLYTQNACILTCYYEQIMERCDCYVKPFEPYYPHSVINSTAACSQKDNVCVQAMEDELRTATSCTECSAACHEQTFDLQTSQSYWPYKAFENNYIGIACGINQRACEELELGVLEAQGKTVTGRTTTVRENFLKVNVYYRELNYEDITQQADYLVESFASDIGGTLGLWLGVSVLTGIEVLQLITEVFNYLCKHKIRAS